MAKSLKDILAGVKKSTIVPGSTGDEPGVDYMPKAPVEQEFVKKHKTEKHADRVGNGDDIYQATNIKHAQLKDTKHGYKNPGDKKVNESLAIPLVGGDDDESAEMAKTQLRALANKALHLVMQLSDDQVVEPWVQAKIAVAKDNVSAVHDYMVYGNDKKPEAEQTAPYVGGIDMSGAPRNTYPNFSADVNTGRNV